MKKNENEGLVHVNICNYEFRSNMIYNKEISVGLELVLHFHFVNENI